MSAPSFDHADSRAIFRQALAAHQAGELVTAADAYQQLLDADVDYHEVNYNFALLKFQRGEYEAGLLLLQRACAALPRSEPCWLAMIDALLHLGRHDQAQGALAHAEAQSDSFSARALAGRRRRLEQMRDAFGRVPAAADVEALSTPYQAGDYVAFEAHARQLLAGFPDFALAWKALGVALLLRNAHEEALPVLERCSSLIPEDAEVHNNLGSVQHRLGLLDGAVTSFRRVLRLQPGFRAAQRNLAIALADQRSYGEAEQLLRALLHELPQDVLAHASLGELFMRQQRYPEAEVSFRQTLALQPDFVDGLSQLAEIHRRLGRVVEAEAGFERALALDPTAVAALDGLASLRLLAGQPEEAVVLAKQAVELAPDNLAVHSSLLFRLNYAARRYDSELFAWARRYGDKLAVRRPTRYEAWALEPAPARLRVGLVSGDFRRHPVGFFIEGILPALDRERLELIAYPSCADEDVLTAQLKASFAAWRPIHHLNDAQAAARIHADGIHVLIDLSGHTAHHRLGVFACKPAPVQVSWPGFFATTGVAEMDWFIADPLTVPPEHERWFCERICRLPHSRLCFTPPVDAPAVAELPWLERQGPTFATFQNPNKFNDAVLQLWARVLTAVPQARLRIQSSACNENVSALRLQRRFAAAGIDPQQLSFHPSTDYRRYLAAHGEVDIILDTFPYSGGTTTCEALWMGVPTLTLAGETLIARQGVSLLHAAGLTDWVADDEDDFVARAVAFTSDAGALASLRRGLRSRLLASPLFDTPAFAADLEGLLWQLWQAAGTVPLCAPAVTESPQPTEPASASAFGAGTAEKGPDAQALATLRKLYHEQDHAALADYARQLTVSHPEYGHGWKALGVALQALDRDEEALAAMEEAVRLLPEDVEAVGNLGLVWFKLEKYAEAADCQRRALALDPLDTDAIVNLAAALFRLDRLEEASALLSAAVARQPEHFGLRLRLAEALWKQKKYEAAAEHCQQAAELGLNQVEAHYSLGKLFYEMQRHAEAERSLRYALKLDPQHQRVKGMLGLVLLACNRFAEAEQLYRAALAEEPEMAEHYCNLATAVKGLGRLEESFQLLRRALELKPDWVEMHSNLLFGLNYAAADDPQQLFDEARSYGVRVATRAGAPCTRWTLDPQPQRLRVGLVSGDLGLHPVGYFLEGILPVLDRQRLELIAYPTKDRNDVLTEQLKSSFERWQPLWALSDEAAVERIRADGIHVLIDLSGHTGYNRLAVFARRPAPVQLSWPGYFATTGVAQMDWFIADRVTVPESSQCYFTEQIYYLPETRLCFTPPADAPAVAPLPALASGQLTFGCFQNLSKVNNKVLAHWGRIMAAVPHSRLRMQVKDFADEGARQRMLERLQAAGIAAERVSLHAGTSRREYLAAHAEVDLILDTFPYTGGTTTCEALWMGVPTLTLCGSTLIARQGASMMQAAGLDQWVVDDLDSYVSRALALAADVPALADLRASMRQRLLQTALFDTPRFAAQLEDALWAMWQSHLCSLQSLSEESADV